MTEMEKKKSKTQANKKSLKKRKKIKKTKKRYIITIILILFILCLFLVYFFIHIKSIKLIDMKIIVGKNIGFDVTPEYLNFGKVIAGSGSTRTLIISNEYNYNVTANIFIFGKIKEYTQISENYIVVEPKETKSISIRVEIPKGTEEREIKGKALVIIKT